MKTIESIRTYDIPEGVTVTVKTRVVTVKGPRGTLVKSFKHLHVDMKVVGTKNKTKFVVSAYFASRKELACLRTITSHIKNMVTGVLKGFEYKMRTVYAHFPIGVSIVENGKVIEIRNFLGEKIVRRVPMLEGVEVARSTVKDEIVLTGNDVELVSQSAADIHHSVMVKNKDIRKFLDGIYVSEKHVIGQY